MENQELKNSFEEKEIKYKIENKVNEEKEKNEEEQKTVDKEIKQINKFCLNCKIENVELLKCGQCKKVNYCSFNCQKQDWPNHKKICVFPKKDSTKAKIKRDFDSFYDIKKIGDGNFSEIFKATCKSTNKVYAIKQINKQRVKQLHKEADIVMEKYVLEKLNDCKYVTNIYETFQDELSMFIMMEYVNNGELWNEIRIFGLP